MDRYLKILFAAVLLVGLYVGTSFAIPDTVSFTDTMNPGESLSWTHRLDNSDFTPSLGDGETITVTDALLTIWMDFKGDKIEGTSTKLFQVTAAGDFIELETFNSIGTAGDVNNYRWSIDVDTLSNAATVLQAINDRSFAVVLSVDSGKIKNIDSATLSGIATVVQADPIDPNPIDPINVPEPSTVLLLGAGLAGFGFLRKNI